MRFLHVGITILLLISICFVGYGIYRVNQARKTLNELQVRVDNVQEATVEQTVHTFLTEPDMFFVMLEDHPEWEEIESVPYSKCYRHLIATSTADVIFCKAI